MKNLKTILQHRVICYIFLIIVFVLYLINSNLEYVSVYDSFEQEEFTISNIILKDYGFKLEFQGKEKVLGFLYLEEQEEINSFLEEYNLGDKVLVSGDISLTTNNTVPNTFNYQKYLVSNGIYNVIEVSEITKLEDNKNVFYKLKNILLERGERLTKSSPYISSLIFGNNNYLDEEVEESYRENGVSHLFAISGLHITLFIVILGKFLDKFKTNEILKYIILILFLFFYMFLTNFSMSVLRGAVFTILILINKIFNLKIPTVNLLLWALVIIMFNNPLFINNVGLQYSFLVTLFLILFSDIINRGGAIYKLFIISFIAFLVSYPITINNFNQVNFLSIVYNIFFVPYVSYLLLPLVLISYIFPFLDGILYFFIQIIEVSSQFLIDIDIGKINMCKMNVLMIVLYFVIICRLFIKWDSKKLSLLFLVVVFFIAHYFMPFNREDYIMFLDIGQGDSSLISVNNSYTLVDTGGVVMYDDKEYTYKLAKNKILPYFHSVGIRKLDNLVLTHGDADHMKEAYYIIDNFKVSRVYLNTNEMNTEERKVYKLCKEKGIETIFLDKNRHVNIGGYKFKSLNRNRKDENASSIVLYGEINNYKILLTGDITREVELDILSEYKLNKVHILKLAHHGSKTSSDYNFLKGVSPKYSVISSGFENRFGHPNKETIDSLEKLKLKYFNTAYDGSIKFSLENGTYSLYPP